MARRSRGSRTRGGVTDTDRGYADLRATLAKLAADKPHVVVGIRGEKGATKGTRQRYGWNRRDGVTETTVQDTATLVEIGAFNEFGTARIPERSFLRSTFDANRESYARGFRKGLERVIDGSSDIDTELGRLGLVVAGDVQQTIATLTDPPLAQETIEGKLSSKPLIDTGRLKQSIDHEVRRGE